MPTIISLHADATVVHESLVIISGLTVPYVQVCTSLCNLSGCKNVISNRAKPFKRHIQARGFQDVTSPSVKSLI